MQNQKKSSRKTPRRPVTPGKGRAIVGRDLWLAAVKKGQGLTLSNSYRPGSPRHKTSTEYFVDSLRKTGKGISAETHKSQSMTGLKGNNQHYPYLSTSHYMRLVMGTEKTPRGADDSTPRANAGTPAYKTPEEYYDEVLALKKQIAGLTIESATLKTKIRRLEDEVAKKDKEIDSLLNPEKNADIRRTMADRQADSGAIVHSLKQKILKLEMQLRDKESAFCKLQADIKTTKIEEMRIQLEAVYAELMRQQLSKDSTTEKSKPGNNNNNAAKIKALNETVIRLSRTNEMLQGENRSLKEDLDKALQDSHVKLDVSKEYGDMNRAELLMIIADLEKKLDQSSQRASVYSQDSSRKSTTGKIELRGTVEDRLHQLDQRESELLDEYAKMKAVLQRSREDKKNIHDLGSLPPTPRRRQSKQIEYDQGSVTPRSTRLSSRRASSAISETAASERSKYQNGPSEEEPRQSTPILQASWRHGNMTQRVTAFRENRAARKLQHGWLDYKKRRYDDELDDAAFVIQGALRGHSARRQQMQKWSAEDSDTNSTISDEGVSLIQSTLRGHRSRQQQLCKWKDIDFDTEDDNVSLASSGRRPSSAVQQSPSVHRRVSTSRGSSGRQSPHDRRSPVGRPHSGRIFPSDRKSPVGRPHSGRISPSDRRSPVGRPPSGRISPSDRRLSLTQRPASASSSKRGSISQTFKAKYDVPGPSSAVLSDGDDDDDDDIMF